MRSKIALSTCVVKPAGEATLISIQRPVTVGRVGVRTGLGVGAGVPNALKTDPMLPLTALPTLLLTGEGSTIGALTFTPLLRVGVHSGWFGKHEGNVAIANVDGAYRAIEDDRSTRRAATRVFDRDAHAKHVVEVC